MHIADGYNQESIHASPPSSHSITMTHDPSSGQPAASPLARLRRREFIASLAAGTVATGRRLQAAATKQPELQVGEGVAEITPPLGIELGGFHRAPGNER
jgi:hypothetical protein